MKLNNRGFTLVEMIVVTAIFVVVIMITGDAFKTVLTQSSKLYKSEESNIEGVVGLEMFRHDLEQAGFGLPYSYDATTPIVYKEAGYAPANTYNDATTLNADGTPNRVPRAFVAGDGVSNVNDTNSNDGGTYGVIAGTDYLAIKATSVGGNDASQKWTYLNYSTPPNTKPAKIWPSGNLKSGDKIIMLRRTFQDTGYGNQLVYATHDASGATLSSQSIYWVGFAASGYVASYSPALPTEIFYLYGINSSSDVGMPFNRVDYFVSRPSNAAKIPTICEPSTGILYRATVNHESSNPGGKLTYMPIIDCVADMQVVFGWDLADAGGNLVTDPNSTGDGQIETWSNADGSVASGLTLPSLTYVRDTLLIDPAHIRSKLRIVKVYILAQNGKKDLSYTSPASILIGDEGERSLTRPAGFPITSAMQNYRWKVYRLVVRPKNLISNQ